jgi:putative DNA primase/helicase
MDNVWDRPIDLGVAPEVPENPDAATADHGIYAFRWWRKMVGEKAVLVPCVDKKPIVRDVKGLTAEKMDDTDYGLQFADRKINVAVKLGSGSGGVIAIEFDLMERAKEWIDCNAWIRGMTLMTKSARGCAIWMRMKGEYPGSSKLDGFYEWRSDGNLMVGYGWHEGGQLYREVEWCEPILEVAMDQLKWPDGWEAPGTVTIEDEIQRDHGEFLPVSKGGCAVNFNAIAKLFNGVRELFYDPEIDAIYEYNPKSGLWMELNWNDVVRDMIGFVTEMVDLHKKADPENVGHYEKVKHGMGKTFVQNLHSAAAYSVRSVKRREVEKFGQRFIHVDNGVVDLETVPHTFKPFSKEFYSFNGTDVKYDPNARCDRFLGEFLMRQVDQDEADVLQMWVGMCLMGWNVAQKILLMHGPGRTGKSVFCGIVQRLVGKRNVSEIRTDLLGTRFELGLVRNKTLLLGSDVGDDFMSGERVGKLKGMTGGDLLMAEMKGVGNQVEVRGTFNVLVVSNHRLKINLEGEKTSWARRIVSIGFMRPVEGKVIPNFDRVLMEEEGSGILNWAIRGAEMIVERFGTEDVFPMSERLQARTQAALDESDSIGSFCSMCICRGMGHDGLTRQQLLEAYYTFCARFDWAPQRERLFHDQIKSILMAQPFRAIPDKHVGRTGDNHGSRGFKGITFAVQNGGEKFASFDPDFDDENGGEKRSKNGGENEDENEPF